MLNPLRSWGDDMKVPTLVSAQIATPKTPMALFRVDGVSPEAFGAGIGRALQGIGAALGDLGASKEREQKALENAKLSTQFSDFSEQLVRDQSVLQQQTPPDDANAYDVQAGFLDSEAEKFIAANVPAARQEEFRADMRPFINKLKLEGYNFQQKQLGDYYSKVVSDGMVKAQNLIDQGKWTRAQAEDYISKTIMGTNLPEITKQQLAFQTHLAIAKQDYKRAALSEVASSVTDAASLIRKFEGYRGTAYADHHTSDGSFAGYRVGFGADTVVRADGSIERVTANTVISQADAERTLQYRINNQYIPTIVKQVGQANWDALPQNAKAGLLSVAWNYTELPGAVVEAVGTGDTKQIADAVAGLAANKSRRAEEAAVIRGSTGAYRRQKYLQVTVAQGNDGYWHAPNVSYALRGKVRHLPVSRTYVQTISGIASEIAPGLEVRITSGAQAAEGSERIGSHRHDVDPKTGEGQTADMVLVLNGRAILPAQNQKLYADFIERSAAAGMTGIGHYSWGIHIGGGEEAAWGPDTTSNTLDPEFKAAFERGRAQAQGGIDADPSFSNIPYEDRAALFKDAQTEILAKQNEDEAARKEAHASFMNETLVGIRNGSIGQAQIDSFITEGKITDYSDMEKLDGAVKKYQEDQSSMKAGLSLLGSGQPVDPFNADHRKAIDSVFTGTNGTSSLQDMSEEYLANNLIPMVSRSQIIPPTALGTLVGMLRSADSKQVGYAALALNAIQQASPDAYAQQVGEDTQNKITVFNAALKSNPPEKAVELLGGTPQTREAQARLLDDADTLLRKQEFGMTATKARDMFDGWFTRAPSLASGVQQQVLSMDYEDRFKQVYMLTGDAEEARTKAEEFLRRTWGVFDGKLLKYPPDRMGYLPVGGDYSYVDRDIRRTLKLADDEGWELVGDDRTITEYKQGKKPSYTVIRVKNGVRYSDPKMSRMVFEPDDQARAIDEENWRRTKLNADMTRTFNEMNIAIQQQAVTGTPIPPELQAKYDQLLKESSKEDNPLRRMYDSIMREQEKNKQVNPFGNFGLGN